MLRLVNPPWRICCKRMTQPGAWLHDKPFSLVHRALTILLSQMAVVLQDRYSAGATVDVKPAKSFAAKDSLTRRRSRRDSRDTALCTAFTGMVRS